MNKNTFEYRQAESYGKHLVGKKAQSTILTEISHSGKKVHQAPQEITGFEIVEMFMEPTLMVTLGGESVFESSLFNIR